MNLRNNKGFTEVDISIAMILILIFIPTIFGIVYNVQKIRVGTERQVEALNIATDVLEIAKSIDYSEVKISDEDNEFKRLLSTNYTNLSVLNENTINCNYSADNDVHYKIEINVTNYYPPEVNNSDKEDYIKKITATVTYPVAKSTKSINISTVLQNKN